MEEHLTLEELTLLINSNRETEHRSQKFAAALKGIDLDEGQETPEFDEIKRKVQAELSGKTEEQYVFDMVGIEIDTDDEDDVI